RIISHITGEDVEEFHDTPEVHLGLAYRRTALRPIGFDEKEMTGTPDLKIHYARIGSVGRPEDVARDGELPHDIPGLREIAHGLRPGRRDRTLIGRLLAVLPMLMKRPGRMIEQQAAESKEPQEEDQEQTGVEMQFPIPAFKDHP